LEWDGDFKGDVSLKTLLAKLDKGISRRNRQIKATTEAERLWIKKFKKYYNFAKPLKFIAIFLYIFLPIFEKPSWCLKNPAVSQDTCNDEAGTYANSNIPKIPPLASNITYLVCLAIMLAFTYARDTYREAETPGVRVAITVLTVIAATDLIVCIIYEFAIWNVESIENKTMFQKLFMYPWINSFIRPVLFTVSLSGIRTFWLRYLQVIWYSLPMVIFIMVFVYYFSWMGQRLYSGTIEGVQSFKDGQDAFFFMFVLLTTSNNPDVWLPSYNSSRINFVFFGLFLILGLFLFFNLLLAIFYSSYQEKADDDNEGNREDRNNFLFQLFNTYDKEKKGYLDKKQTFDIIKEFHTLVNQQDAKIDDIKMTHTQYDQLFKVMDTTKSGNIGPREIPNVLKAYETWLYEKEYKKTMEELYSKNVTQ